ncbi:toll-like receptor 4 [Saccostrea cucullata]|uniref:toll-like receptor 4 n=1 Tax=Saccostrea cuccullata TaxID=36930 RepID=UPI002ED3A09D
MGAFQDLRLLEQLDISNNDKLTLESIPNITHKINPGIAFLDFEKIQCTIGTSRVLRKRHVRNLKNTSLEKLNIASNRIAYLELGVTKFIPNTLKYVNAGDNVMSNELYIFELHRLEGLEILNVSYQFRTHQMFPDFFTSCHDDNAEILPKEQDQLVFSTERKRNEQLRKNLTSDVVQHFIITLYIPPKLKVLYIENTQYTLSISIPVIANNSQITHVYGKNNLFMTAFSPIYSINKLEYLDLSRNLLSNITKKIFIDCSNLTFLNLSFNMLGNVLASQKSSTIFKYLPNLEVIDLSSNGITILWPDMFKSFGKLKCLNVSLNKIGNWAVNIGYMKHLTSFDISYNEISVLDRETMDDLELLSSFNPISINLAGNPLMCSCENLPFLNWLHSLISSRHIVFHKLREYRCVFSNGSVAKIGNVHGFIQHLQSECREYPIITLVCAFCITVFLGVSLGKVIHRYRWSLTYWYYVNRGAKRRFKRENVFYYRYDLFISYDEEDRDTALEIVNILENNKHLKCCLPERDFMPGTNMYDNIINSIHVSKRIVCMLSKNYLNSQWSMIEFQIAQMDSVLSKSRKDKNVLIGVFLEKRSLFEHVQYMNKALLSLLESDSCMTYSNDRNAQFVCLEKLCNML